MKKIKLIIKSTNKYGNGVFADENIKSGSIIYTLGGSTMTTGIFLKKVNSGKENIDDPLQVGKRTYTDLDKVSRTFNHSCDPNTGIRKRSEMFALRDIQKGDQITFDYSSTIAPTKFKMRCFCNSKKCRKIIGDIRTVPLKQIEYYESKGALQTYMKKIIKEIKNKTYNIPKYEIELLNALEKTDNF